MRAVSLREWSQADPSSDQSLAGARLDGPIERAAAAALARAGRLSIEELASGLRVSSLSYVGRVQLGSLTVTIEPKLAAQPLLALVRYAYGLRDLERHQRSSFAAGHALLADLLVAQLALETRELMARGMSRRYVPRNEALGSPRGRIDVASLARRPSAATSLPCRHHVRSADHTLQQVLLGGLDLAARITVDRALRVELRRLHAQLAADVSVVPLTHTRVVNARRASTRLDAAAMPALTLVELLIQGQSVELNGEDVLRLPGFLFDMNRFFQALLGRWLRENLPECEVKDERALSGLLQYAPDRNPRGRRAPAPRPDFAVRSKERPIVLLDAKYRDLWDRSLPREMLYQLAMYATSGTGDPVAVILYPTEAVGAVEARIDVFDVVGGGARAGVALRPVPLAELAALVNAPVSKRSAEARRMAFG